MLHATLSSLVSSLLGPITAATLPWGKAWSPVREECAQGLP